MVILVVALVVIGPSKLPEMAKTLGKAMGEFRRMSTDVKRTIEMEADRQDHKPASAGSGPRGAAADSETTAAPGGAAAKDPAPEKVDSVSGDREPAAGAGDAQASGQTGSAGEDKA